MKQKCDHLLRRVRSATEAFENKENASVYQDKSVFEKRNVTEDANVGHDQIDLYVLRK